MLLSALFVVLALAAFTAEAVLNQDVSQTFDFTSAIVRYSADIKASDVNGEYDLAFPNKWADRMAFLSVSIKGKAADLSGPESNANFTVVRVKVGSNSQTVNLKVSAVFTEVWDLQPAEISQLENQMVNLHTNHYFFSPYSTATQKLVLKLASGTIESFTKLSPHNVRGSTVQFGPFQNIPPLQISPLDIHFVNNHPFAKLSSMHREIEVSHWGNIAYEEVYELQHAGAKLKGGFSRFDYQMRRNVPSPSFRSLVANLPAQASNIYYRDQIGNISTSEVRNNKEGGVDLEIQTRFPLFGGWQTQFYIGYSIPTELALFHSADHSDPSTFNLKCPFFAPFQDVWVQESETKIILPEGAVDISVQTPSSAVGTIEQSSAQRFTFLDSNVNGGRPVVIIRAQNLVPEHAAGEIIVTYRFSRDRLVWKPVLLILSFFACFVVASLFARGSGFASKLRRNQKSEN